MGVFITLCLLFTALVYWKLFNNWKQLDHVPGPRLAGFSDLWRAWYQRRGELRGKLVKLHEQYGPIVRYGVRSVSVNDPSAMDLVYGNRTGFVIADAYKVLVGISNGKEVHSVVTIADEDRHNRLRRSVANAFTATTTLDYEPHIDRTIEELLKSLSKQSTFDMSRKMAYFGLDAASGFAFNSPKGCLAADADVSGMIAVTRDRMRHWSRWGSLHGIERLLYRNPISLRLRRAPTLGIVSAARSRLSERRKTPQLDTETPDLLTRFLEAMDRNPDALDEAAVISLLMSMISAASDTSANALVAIFFHLLKTTQALATLLTELQTANLSTPIPSFSEVHKLPYLAAVIKEGMRLFPALTHPLERLVPSGGITLCNTFLSQGTSVGALQIAMHLNKKVFGEDAAVFRPERWLEASAEQLRVMEVAHLGFGRGRRVCIGQHIAVMEMKKVIPAILMGFDMSLKDPEAGLEADFDLGVACPRAMMVDITPKA